MPSKGEYSNGDRLAVLLLLLLLLLFVVVVVVVSLRFYLKEQAHELKYQGEKKIEEVVTNREVVWFLSLPSWLALELP